MAGALYKTCDINEAAYRRTHLDGIPSRPSLTRGLQIHCSVQLILSKAKVGQLRWQPIHRTRTGMARWGGPVGHGATSLPHQAGARALATEARRPRWAAQTSLEHSNLLLPLQLCCCLLRCSKLKSLSSLLPYLQVGQQFLLRLLLCPQPVLHPSASTLKQGWAEPRRGSVQC